MTKVWDDSAWDDYVYWQGQDRNTLKKINSLLKDIESNGPNKGIGKPEPLKHELSGYYSRRIDEENRLVYIVENDMLKIIQCRTHYEY